MIFCPLILKDRLKSFISVLNIHNKYVNPNAEKNRRRVPYLKMLSRSGVIRNTPNLKFILLVEPEIVCTTTVYNILLRDTDVPLTAGWKQNEARHYTKYCER
jgi:hypothetical protein